MCIRDSCESVAERLRDNGFRCRTVQIGLRDNTLASYERQKGLARASCTTQDIFTAAFALYKQNKPEKPIRSVSVRACNLTVLDDVQLSLFPEAARSQKQEQLETAIDGIRDRFGHFASQRGVMLTDLQLSALDAKG